MPKNRTDPICGIATNKEGKRHIVLGGGNQDTSIDTLDLETWVWKREPKTFPFSACTHHPTTVEYGRSFLIIGGSCGGGVDTKAIYKASYFQF